MLCQLADDMAQVMNLLLPRDMALGATRILNVLLPARHLPQRLRFRALGVPHLHCKNHRVLTWLVIEHGFDGRVRINAAVPVRFAVHADRRKRRRQRTRSHHVLETNGLVAVIEVTHLAVVHIDRAHREPHVPAVDVVEIDHLGECFA